MPYSQHDMPLPAEWPTSVPMAISWTGAGPATATARPAPIPPPAPAPPSPVPPSPAEGALPAWSAAPAALAAQAAQLAFNATLPAWDETPPRAELAALAAGLALHLSLQPDARIGFDAAAVLDEDAPEPSREEVAQALSRLLRGPSDTTDRLWYS